MPGQYSLASAAIARQGTLRRLWVPQLDCLATNMGTEIDCRLNRFKVGTKCPPSAPRSTQEQWQTSPLLHNLKRM